MDETARLRSFPLFADHGSRGQVLYYVGYGQSSHSTQTTAGVPKTTAPRRTAGRVEVQDRRDYSTCMLCSSTGVAEVKTRVSTPM